jgi:hypothetical protein
MGLPSIRSIVPITLVALVVILLLVSCAPTPDLHGTWRMTKVVNGRIGLPEDGADSMLVLGADGHYTWGPLLVPVTPISSETTVLNRSGEWRISTDDRWDLAIRVGDEKTFSHWEVTELSGSRMVLRYDTSPAPVAAVTDDGWTAVFERVD